jgi:hypothetical protein
MPPTTPTTSSAPETASVRSSTASPSRMVSGTGRPSPTGPAPTFISSTAMCWYGAAAYGTPTPSAAAPSSCSIPVRTGKAARFVNCVIADNTGGSTGGVDVQGAGVAFVQCAFLGNHAASEVGALRFFGATGVQIQNCVFSGNSSGQSTGRHLPRDKLGRGALLVLLRQHRADVGIDPQPIELGHAPVELRLPRQRAVHAPRVLQPGDADDAALRLQVVARLRPGELRRRRSVRRRRRRRQRCRHRRRRSPSSPHEQRHRPRHELVVSARRRRHRRRREYDRAAAARRRSARPRGR